MSYTVEIDQSGRTDVLTIDTVLALSNDVQYAILIPKLVKQKCYAQLKARGIRKAIVGIRLFAAGLVLLLEQFIELSDLIIIDLEYVGWEGEIKQHILRQLRAKGHKIEKNQIIFRKIGKKSSSHDLAWKTLRGSHTPERLIGVNELINAC